MTFRVDRSRLRRAIGQQESGRLVAVVCAAQALVQIGAFFAVAFLMLLALGAFLWFRPRELAGDRSA